MERNEKRKEERIETRLPVWIGSHETNQPAHIVDLSSSGARIRCRSGYPPGMTLNILIRIGGEEHLLTSVVRHCTAIFSLRDEEEKYDIGVHFPDELQTDIPDVLSTPDG